MSKSRSIWGYLIVGIFLIIILLGTISQSSTADPNSQQKPEVNNLVRERSETSTTDKIETKQVIEENNQTDKNLQIPENKSGEETKVLGSQPKDPIKLDDAAINKSKPENNQSELPTITPNEEANEPTSSVQNSESAEPETTPPPASSGVVKKSVNDICHALGTTYYNRTKNFTPYNSLEDCLASGGRLPLR